MDARALERRLAEVEDPEVPITLKDLGVLRSVAIDGARVTVSMVPTRLGCPGRSEMERRVLRAAEVADPRWVVTIEWTYDQWSPVSITAHGRSTLQEQGYIAGPAVAVCPYCGSNDVRREGEFGGSLCKQPLTCRSCGSPFDALRGAAGGVSTES